MEQVCKLNEVVSCCDCGQNNNIEDTTPLGGYWWICKECDEKRSN